MRTEDTAAARAGASTTAGASSGADRFELLRALAVLCEAPQPSHDAIAEALGLPGGGLPEEHTSVFVLQCHPFASFHLSSDGTLGGEAGDRVAGFWRALGLVPPTAPDHLATLLGLYAALGIEELDRAHSDAMRAGLTRARETLLWEHLMCWVPALLAAVCDTAAPQFRAWAVLLGEALAAEAEAVAGPSCLPLALRQAPEPLTELGSPGGLDGLLAPARSGLVLTRGRLAAGAGEIGVGLRQGERRFTIRAMFDQDPAGTVAWLACQAQRWVDLHRRWMPEGGGIGAWWRDRAAATAQVLATSAVRGGDR